MPQTADALYGQLAHLHERMLEAARREQWDRLPPLQAEVDATVAQLQQTREPRLNPAQLKARATLIQGVLNAQHEIRAEIAHWQDDVRPLLDTLNKPSAPSSLLPPNDSR